MHPHRELNCNVCKPGELLQNARILNCSAKQTLLIRIVVINLALDGKV